MYDVLHPATSEDSDPQLRNPVWYILGIASFVIAQAWSFTAAVILLLVGAAVQAVIKHYKESKDWKGWEAWPIVKAKVEYATVRQGHSGNSRGGTFPMGELAYSYSVEGAFYSGFCRCRFTREKEVDCFVEEFRGASIPVRYNPAKPELSLAKNI